MGLLHWYYKLYGLHSWGLKRLSATKFSKLQEMTLEGLNEAGDRYLWTLWGQRPPIIPLLALLHHAYAECQPRRQNNGVVYPEFGFNVPKVQRVANVGPPRLGMPLDVED